MSVSRHDAEAFFDAMMSRDPARIAPYVADDAEWLIVGPTELFAYCGQHLGKEAVLAAYGRMGRIAAVTDFAREFTLTDGESASALTRMTVTQSSTGRQVVARLAQFARFRDGKVCEFCSIFDAFSVVEQLVEHAQSPALADA